MGTDVSYGADPIVLISELSHPSFELAESHEDHSGHISRKVTTPVFRVLVGVA